MQKCTSMKLFQSMPAVKVKTKSISISCSVMLDSAMPWAITHQAPLSMEFSRQEHWSGLPCSPPGDLPNPGIEPASPVSCIAGGFFTIEPLGKPLCIQSIC